MAEIRNRADDIDDINQRTRGGKTRSATIPDSHTGILQKKGFAHLASLGPDGEPQSHPIWFDFDATRGQLLISTGTDRQKYRNIQRDPRVSVSILDPDDPYRYLEIRGHVVKIEPDPEKAFLDRLARKYLDLDTYPYEQRRNVERVVIHIQPDHVIASPAPPQRRRIGPRLPPNLASYGTVLVVRECLWPGRFVVVRGCGAETDCSPMRFVSARM